MNLNQRGSSATAMCWFRYETGLQAGLKVLPMQSATNYRLAFYHQPQAFCRRPGVTCWRFPVVAHFFTQVLRQQNVGGGVGDHACSSMPAWALSETTQSSAAAGESPQTVLILFGRGRRSPARASRKTPYAF